MALIRSVDPERFNAETLARMYFGSNHAVMADVDRFQELLDAMVAEGILSTEEPLESGESSNIAEAIREWRRINTVPKIRETGYGSK